MPTDCHQETPPTGCATPLDKRGAPPANSEAPLAGDSAKNGRPRQTPWRATVGTLGVWLLATWLVLILIRAHVMGYGWHWLDAPLEQGWPILAGSYQDLLYVGGVGVIFGLPLLVLRRPGLRLAACVLFAVAISVSLIWAMVNVPMVKMLGQPLNYAWLYNSGFLRSIEAFEGLYQAITWPILATAVAAIAGFLILGYSLQRLLDRLSRTQRSAHLLWLGAFLLVCCYLPLAMAEVAGFYRPMLSNPVVAFAQSLLPADPPRIFSMKTSLPPDDFLGRFARNLPPLPPFAPAGIRNVLVIVLESVPAQYLPAYGSRFAVTPELDRYRRSSRIFEAVHAHAPNTNKTMVSLLCSTYPSPTYLLETQEYAAGRFVSLSDVLKAQGYRTGLFYAADLRFGNADAFLGQHRFDVLADHRSIGDGKPNCISKEAMPFLDAVDDAAVGQATAEWINADREQPFFALMWTGQTHYPYFNMSAPIDFEVNDELHARYLNALREGDQAIGRMLRLLEESNRLDSTLVVIVGDHGEAFSQHHQYGHGSMLYSENVQVPLLLINPRLFKGERDGTVGGTVDLAPTILHILGQTPPNLWQGDSLFAPQRSGRTYFVAPWSKSLFGYREGDRKYIFCADDDRCEVYDLKADPGELNDLAATLAPAELELVRHRLATWVQYQLSLLEDLGAPR